MLSTAEFEIMSKNPPLVSNIARGPIIDTAALVAALKDGKVRAAALDVTDPEPLNADSELWDMPNVLITPQTVPSRPRNGAPLTAIASRMRPDSSLSDSWATVFSSDRLTCSIPLSETKRFRPAPSGSFKRASSSTLPAW